MPLRFLGGLWARRSSWCRGCQIWVGRLDTPVCRFISRTDGLEGPGLMSCGPSLPRVKHHSPEKEAGPPWILLSRATHRPPKQRCGSGPSRTHVDARPGASEPCGRSLCAPCTLRPACAPFLPGRMPRDRQLGSNPASASN